MSRLAKKPIIIPFGTNIKINDYKINICGPKGQLNFTMHSSIEASVIDNLLYVTQNFGINYNKAILGTTYVLFLNMIKGVNNEFSKKLILKGVGYKAKVDKKLLELSLGYSHPVFYKIPNDVNVEVFNNIEIVVSGVCKQQVGQVSADIRNKRLPEAYKGKGIRYSDEVILLKETKKK